VSTEVGIPKATGNPYVGPEAFRRGDAFYGRDRETADLLDLLIAERVVLLYSPSGAGKSSLIAAGLVRQLEAEGFEVLPTVRLTNEPPPGSSLSGPPRNRYALSTLLSLEEGLPPEYQHRTAELDAMTVAEYLANRPDLDQKPGNDVLLFDQFEEVITADPNDRAAKEEFFADIGIALSDRNLWALFAIREDFLAELDPYSRFVPTRFANRYRLDLLGVDQALDAMILPAADRGTDFKREAAEKLADDLRRIRVQRSDGIAEELGPTVEPVQLQVACRQVWNRRLGADTKSIDLDDVEAVGNVDQALASYYADCVAAAAAESGVGERALRDWFENELVTPQGIRGQVLYGPRQNGAFSEGAVKMLTGAHLVRAESRRGATWYELAHDRLIEPVKEDNARWREEHLSYFVRLAAWWDEQNRPDQALLAGDDLIDAEKWVADNAATLSPREQEFFDASRKAADQAERERRAAKRTRRWLVIAVVGCVLAAAFGGWAWRAQQQAEDSAAELEIAALAGEAREALESDVDLGLLLARHAAALPGGSPTDRATQNALQLAVDQSPVVKVLRGHGSASSAVYSPDGRRIASYHDDHSIVVWDAASGDELYTLPELPGGLIKARTLVFSPDGSQIAAVAADGRIAVWPAEVGAGEPTWITPHGDASSWRVGFSPDGRRLAALGVTGLSVVDESGRAARGFDAVESVDLRGEEVEWTPDGKHLVIGDTAGVVSVWDPNTGEHVRDIVTHPSRIVAIDVSPDGSMVASVSETVVQVNAATGDVLYYLDRGGLSDISFSGDGTRAVAIDKGGTAIVIDPSESEAARWVTATGLSVRTLDLDPSNAGRAVVTTDSGYPAIWDVTAGYYDYEAAIKPLPDGGVITGSWDGSVVTWTADLTPRVLLPASWDPVQDLEVSQDGQRIAVARKSAGVEVIDTSDSRLLFSMSMGEQGAWAVALRPDGRFVAGGDGGGRVVVWEVSTGTEVASSDQHEGSVVSLEYSAEASQLVSASNDQTAIIWDVDPLRPARELQLETRARAAAWNNTGTLIAVGGEDGSVQFWDPATGERLHEGSADGHAKAVHDVAFNAAGDRLASASEDRSIIVWNTETGTDNHLVRQGNPPFRLTFDASGERIYVGDGNGSPHVVFLDGDELLRAAEDQTTRELTGTECRRHLGEDADCPED
jgi:WD40 repeat protein